MMPSDDFTGAELLMSLSGVEINNGRRRDWKELETDYGYQ